jgi:hypothetical protein
MARKPASPSVRNRQGSIFGNPVATQCKTSRTRRVGTALAHKGEPRRRSVLVEHLASHNLEVPFRATVSIPYVSPSKPRTASSQEELTERLARTSADFRSRLPTFMVRLRTVLTLVSADIGSNSLKNSVALPNGNKAAILAVR